MSCRLTDFCNSFDANRLVQRSNSASGMTFIYITIIAISRVSICFCFFRKLCDIFILGSNTRCQSSSPSKINISPSSSLEANRVKKLIATSQQFLIKILDCLSNIYRFIFVFIKKKRFYVIMLMSSRILAILVTHETC